MPSKLLLAAERLIRELLVGEEIRPGFKGEDVECLVLNHRGDSTLPEMKEERGR